MSKIKLLGSPSLPNIPWEDKPEGTTDVVWRYSQNPIIPWNYFPSSNSIYNSSVAPYKNGFAGVFRVDDRRYKHLLHVGFSDDGIQWKINSKPISFTTVDPSTPLSHGGYDPRLTKIGNRYYITWCNGGCGGPSVGIAWTEDFKKFHQLENAFPPHNRNGALFPRKIDGEYLLLNRPSAPGHFAHGSIVVSRSKDLDYWGKHRLVMAPVSGWNDTKIGAGPSPLETSVGWLLLYHGVQTTCNGFIYRMGGAILDRKDPTKVLHRSAPFLLAPRETYELVGDVPNVVFPCGLLADKDTGRLAIYYGAADTSTALAFAQVDELVDYIKANRENR